MSVRIMYNAIKEEFKKDNVERIKRLDSVIKDKRFNITLEKPADTDAIIEISKRLKIQ